MLVHVHVSVFCGTVILINTVPLSCMPNPFNMHFNMVLQIIELTKAGKIFFILSDPKIILDRA